jgi:hypothetical protein
VPADDTELRELLFTIEQLLVAMRRLVSLSERLAARASLNLDERRDVRAEIEMTRATVDKLEVTLTPRGQQMRPM